jgi:hypothetical protein
MIKKQFSLVSIDGFSRVNIFHVKACDKQSVIDFLRYEGYAVDGHRIDSDYDCSGQWFANSADLRNVKWSSAFSCYVFKMHWHLDV